MWKKARGLTIGLIACLAFWGAPVLADGLNVGGLIAQGSQVDQWYFSIEQTSYMQFDIRAYERDWCWNWSYMMFQPGYGDDQLDSHIYLFKVDGTYLGNNNNCYIYPGSVPGTYACFKWGMNPGGYGSYDGSRSNYDSYLALWLPPGEYMLAIGTSYLSSTDAWDGEKESDGRGFQGHYVLGFKPGNDGPLVVMPYQEWVAQNSNSAPQANAGSDITLATSEVAATVLSGLAVDEDEGDELEYRWLEGGAVLQDWLGVGAGGECPLDLAFVDLGIGDHELTLEVTDGSDTSSGTVTVSVVNSSPAAAGGGAGSYEVGTGVMLTAEVSDFDGDPLAWQWTLEGDPLCSGVAETLAGGDPVALPACVVEDLDLGWYPFELEVTDGENIPLTSTVEVEIVDETSPTLAPVIDKAILWPPNNKMVPVVLDPGAADNSGQVTVTTTVTCNETDDDDEIDVIGPEIDPVTGLMLFEFRAQRHGDGDGRTYFVEVRATDAAGNYTVAIVEVQVPHDQGKKK